MNRTAMIIQQIALFFKFFAGETIPALLPSQINIALIPHALKKLIDDRLMARISRTNEAIVLNVVLLPKCFKAGSNLITMVLGC